MFQILLCREMSTSKSVYCEVFDKDYTLCSKDNLVVLLSVKSNLVLHLYFSCQHKLFGYKKDGMQQDLPFVHQVLFSNKTQIQNNKTQKIFFTFLKRTVKNSIQLAYSAKSESVSTFGLPSLNISNIPAWLLLQFIFKRKGKSRAKGLIILPQSAKTTAASTQPACL